MGEGVVGYIRKIVGGGEKKDEARKHRKEGREAEARAQGRIESLDWTPEYASDHVDPYKRTESPVARAYLESFLTGSNPATTPSFRHGSAEIKKGQQAQFDKTYGGWDKLEKRQREIEQETPWEVKPFTGDPRGDWSDQAKSIGVDPYKYQIMREQGMTHGQIVQAEEDAKWHRDLDRRTVGSPGSAGATPPMARPISSGRARGGRGSTYGHGNDRYNR